MLVLLGPRVEQHPPAGRADTPQEAELAEQLESRIDRRKRDVRKPLLDGAEHLLGAHVAAHLLQRPVDHETLRRDALATSAERLGELDVGVRFLHRLSDVRCTLL